MGLRKNSDTDLLFGLLAAPFYIAGAVIEDAKYTAKLEEFEERKRIKIAERTERENQKKKILETNIKKLKNIFYDININKLYPIIKYDFKSLHQQNITDFIKVEDLIGLIDEVNLTQIIIYAYNGKRIQAITHLIENTNYTYNQILQIVSSVENNLSALLEFDEKSRNKNELGYYEFEPISKILNIQKDTNDYDAFTNITIECKPINHKEYIFGKTIDVVRNKVIKAFDKIYAKWNKEFCEYHIKRENKIVSNIKFDFDNILNYSIKNPLKPYSFYDEYDNSKFTSKLAIIEKPELQLNDIKSFKKEYQNLQDNPPKIEDIQINFFNKILLKTFFKFIVKEWLNKEFEKNNIKWLENCNKAKQEIENKKQENIAIQEEYNKKNQLYQDYLQEVNIEKKEFLKEQEEYNKTIKNKINNFENKCIEEIVEFFTNILEMSVYPFLKQKNIDISYNKENKIIVIDYEIPNINEIYNIERISFISTKKEFRTEKIKPKELSKFYNNVIYQICIRTIKEIFDADTNYNFIDTAIFNGMVVCNDKSTGQEKTVCICSLQANKKEFNEIDLSNIIPEYCFKLLKGVGAAELNSVTPIMPIRNIDKNDKRFIQAYEILSTINTCTNLAAIYWKDFENLIREVFEKEFLRFNGDVKITQSSRDGGVDAVAFDPDPIRGGKIVIQAKRYTNIVGVSAVRDLYGTIMNEGANSGILVTTSDYGSDAYKFAKGKPINLLNGAQLLGLMRKHGYDCYINLEEAKRMLQDEKY